MAHDTPPSPGDGGRPLRPAAGLGEAGKYLTLGLEMVIMMALCVGGGYWLDTRFETLPWFTVGGSVLGMASLFVQLVRISKSLSARDRARRAREPGRGVGEGPKRPG